MPAKTRHRPARNATSYRPRTRKRRPAVRRSGQFSSPIQAPPLLWTGIGALVAVAASIFLLRSYIIDGFEAVLESFGLGVALLIVVAPVDIRLALRRPELSSTFWRVWGGLHLLVLFAFGVGGVVRPSWQFGDVSFDDVS